MIKKLVFSVAIVVLAAIAANAQIPYQESFEGAPGGSYALNTAFDDGAFDYFDQYAVPEVNDGTGNAARDDFQNGWDGMFGIQSQDHDGEGGPATVSVDVTGIDITGASGLSAVISLGALNSEAGGFDNYEAADGDGLVILATIDGGSAMEIGRFSPPAISANGQPGAGDLYRDDDGDGVGTGDRLTVDLTDYTFDISGTGGSLGISVELTSTSSFEPFAVDNLRIVPEPSSLLVGLIGLLGLVGLRRRH